MREQSNTDERIGVLASYTHNCRIHIAKLKCELLDLLKEGSSTSQIRHKIHYYRLLIKGYEKEIGQVRMRRRDRRINIAQNAISVMLILTMMLTLISVGDSDITGFVTFSTMEKNTKEDQIVIETSKIISLSEFTENSIDGISLTGYHEGEGESRVYFETEKDSRLILAVQGQANFRGCGAACTLLTSSGAYDNLRFDIAQGARLVIEKMEFLTNDLQEFVIYPPNKTIDAGSHTFFRGQFEIANLGGENFSVVLNLEGDFAKYITLDQSIVRFEEKEERHEVGYEISIPSSLPPGTYDSSVVVRYLPVNKFKGVAPSEEYKIRMNVKDSVIEQASNSSNKLLWVFVSIMILVSIVNIVLFMVGGKNG